MRNSGAILHTARKLKHLQHMLVTVTMADEEDENEDKSEDNN
jgi:hypothetical protein